ncbi:MAG: hypothetical protein JNK12_07780 [Acidimicrobiales bacterium]|nr:hypothetical protein [Acidimicrobiales bacterium]
MRRIVVLLVVMTAGLAIGVAPSSAQAGATIVMTPNPVEAGADVTITNTPDAASICQPSTTTREVGSPEGGDVVVLLDQFQGPNEILTAASADSAGNWQVVVQVPEAGEYNVLATCQLNDVAYQPQTLSVTAAAEPPTEPPPSAPPAAPAQPQAAAPAFTG